MRTSPITLRRTVAATGVCLTGLMLTACQAGATISATGVSPTSVATTAASGTAATPTSGAKSGSNGNGSAGTGSTGNGSTTGSSSNSGSGSTVSGCRSDQLKVSSAYNSAYNSGSTLIAFVILTNTSSATCTLDGYAGMDLLDPSGHSLGMKTERVAGSNAMPLNVQTLLPGKAASEEFTFTFAANDQGNGCANAGTISVIPPNQTQALTTGLTSVKTGAIPFFGVCADTITVFPFEPAGMIHV